MEVRADTYLWAIRMYKSRTLAGDAIRAGKVKLNDEGFKPSHVVRQGERYTLNIGQSKKIIEVLELLDKRQSFEVAQKYYADHSPPPEKKDGFPSVFLSTVRREKGSGRPTKKDRRDLDQFDF